MMNCKRNDSFGLNINGNHDPSETRELLNLRLYLWVRVQFLLLTPFLSDLNTLVLIYFFQIERLNLQLLECYRQGLQL